MHEETCADEAEAVVRGLAARRKDGLVRNCGGVAVIVAESDVLIDALAGREPGARAERARRKVEKLLAALTILPFDERAGRAAAEARRELEARGAPIGMADYLIAGICLSRAAPLLTRNRGHLEKVPGLRLGDLAPADT